MAYKVQSGDTLGRIAQSSGASLDQILALNPEITNPNLIRVGQNILLPDTPQDEVVSLESEFDKPAPTEPRSLDDVVSPMEEEPSMTDSVFGTLGDIGSGLVNMFIPKAYGDTTDKIPEDVQLRAGEPPSVEAIADITTAKNPADMAIKYLGIDENKSEGAEAVRGFFDNIGLEGYKKDLTPDQFAQNTSWCAAFVAQVLRDSGIDTMKALGGTDPYAQVRAASYAKAGTGVPINEVKAGDVMVKYHDEETRKKYNTGIAHVGIVAKVEDGEVYYIGGNTGDKVELSSYKLDDNQFDFRRVTGKEDIPPESLPSLLQLRAGKVGRQIVDRVSNFFSNVIS